MLYIIDGTGPDDDQIYARQMNGSMCEKLAKDYNGHYNRGPSLLGTETFKIAQHVFQSIGRDPELRRQPLFLAGHSRGGAAVIRIAQLLKEQRIGVEALFLFDAVDRTGPGENVQHIPGNVKSTYHARRDKIIVNYFEYGARETTRKYMECAAKSSNPQSCEDLRKIAEKYRRLDDAMKLRMRFSYGYFDGIGINFDNCGTGKDTSANNSTYEEKFFLGSHGAIGGSFLGAQDGAWDKPSDAAFFEQIRNSDRAAVASVSAWMKEKFDATKLELHGNVRSEPPPQALLSANIPIPRFKGK